MNQQLAKLFEACVSRVSERASDSNEA